MKSFHYGIPIVLAIDYKIDKSIFIYAEYVYFISKNRARIFVYNTIQKISGSSGDRAWEFREDQKINSKQSSGFLALI